MKLFLYCIFRNAELSEAGQVTGIGGRPVSVRALGTLAAAVSEVEPGELPPNVSRGLAFAAVVEWFYTRCTVVPMRYGSAFDDAASLDDFLDRHAESIHAVLGRLDNCVEMGIRISVPHCTGESPESRRETSDDRARGYARGEKSGRDYLRARKEAFESAGRCSDERRSIVEKFRKALSGLVVDLSEERSSARRLKLGDRGCRISGAEEEISVSVLVRKDLLAAFQEVFQSLKSRKGTEFLLTGPWPPYSFARLNLTDSTNE